MLLENRLPAYPGEILLEEFLNPLGLSRVAFSGHIGVPVQRVNEIVRGKRGLRLRQPGRLPRLLVPALSFG
jgi:addiction module HigA family antidote